jgi:hypothetical protein
MGLVKKKNDERESKDDLIKREVDAVWNKQGDGLLHAEDVVEVAKDPSSPLHDEFEWDDSVAAVKYRLVQARVIIRRVFDAVSVDAEETTYIRRYVSFSEDQTHGGGYRPISIISDEMWKQRLLGDARADLELYRKRYALLEEVIDHIDAAIVQVDALKKKAARKGKK